nr:NADH dehydrogenase subunit 4L [Tettigometridae sp.]
MMFIIFIFLSGLLSLIFSRKHYLMCLLSLEMILMSIFFIIYFFFFSFVYEYFFLIIFLIIGLCDGVLGLSLIVYVVRSIGNDYLNCFILC